MKRQIEFRGKRIDNGEWVYGGYFEETSINVDFKAYQTQYILINTKKALDFHWKIAVDPETVGQYTGLKDKNGTEIYEGDTVKIPVDGNEDFHGSYATYEILNVQGQWVTSYISSETGEKLPKGYLRGFLLDHYEYSGKLFLWSEDYKPETEIEVIGNIHE